MRIAEFSDFCFAFVAFGGFCVLWCLFGYCIMYWAVWRHFPRPYPYSERNISLAPWRGCHFDSIFTHPTVFYIQFNDSSVNVIFRQWINPIASRLLGMATIPINEVQITSPKELTLMCNSATPLKVTLNETILITVDSK